MDAADLPRAIPVCIDRLAARYADPPLDREIAAARADFDQKHGTVCDDEEMFESHVAAFLEWYVLERPATGGEPPVVRAAREGGGDAALLRALALSHRSLFEVLDPHLARPPGMRLLDLINGAIWRVDQESEMTGIGRGDVFEARLVPWQGRVRFGPVFCYHPREARECIHALVEQGREEGWLERELLPTLARMRLQLSRCRNMPARRIYTRRGDT